MERLSYALSVALIASTISGFAALAQSILPPAPDAKGGGNPLQGLGRKDDPSPPRYDDYLPKSTQRSSILDPAGGLGSDSSSTDLGSNGLNGSTSGESGSGGSGSSGGLGTDALEKTLDANGLKLQDVPKMMNKMQQESARVAKEAGIEMGGNEGATGLDQSNGGFKLPQSAGGGGLGGNGGFGGSGLGGNGGPGDSGSEGDTIEFNGSSLARPLGRSLDAQPLASPLTAPPAASSEVGRDGDSLGGTDTGDAAIAGLSGDSRASGSAGESGAPGAYGSRTNPPGSLNAAGEYENGPAGLPPGPGMPSASTAGQRSRQARTVSPNMQLKSPRAQEATDKIRAAIGKQTSKRNETLAPHNGLVPAPPPVMPFSTHQRHVSNTPERQALQMIHKGEYGAAEDQLRTVVSNDPTNLHARYLLAVALVHRKNYAEAKIQYNLIIQKSQDTKLIDLATAGLEKIDR